MNFDILGENTIEFSREQPNLGPSHSRYLGCSTFELYKTQGKPGRLTTSTVTNFMHATRIGISICNASG